MKRWEIIAGVFLILVMFLLMCRWSPFYTTQNEDTTTVSAKYIQTDGVLYPSCRPVQGVIYAKVTSREADGYHLTEFGDPYTMDSDWHYVLSYKQMPGELEIGSVIKVEVRRTVPGDIEEVLRLDSVGFTSENIPMEKVGIFSISNCSVNPIFVPPDNGPARIEESSTDQTAEQIEPVVESEEGCWSPISPCQIDFVGECAYSVPVRRTPLGLLYYWENRTGAPCLE